MSYSFYAIMEGSTDRTFFNRIIRPELRKKYNKVDVFLFSQKPKHVLKKFIAACKNTGKDYAFFGYG